MQANHEYASLTHSPRNERSISTGASSPAQGEHVEEGEAYRVAGMRGPAARVEITVTVDIGNLTNINIDACRYYSSSACTAYRKRRKSASVFWGNDMHL